MKLITVTAGVIVFEHRILIAQRRHDKTLGLLWEFPGGKIEAGETPQECLKREIKEEFSIDISVCDFIMEHTHHYEDFDLHMYVYKATWDGQGTIQICDHEQYKWVNIDELDHYQFAGADLPVVQRLKTSL